MKETMFYELLYIRANICYQGIGGIISCGINSAAEENSPKVKTHTQLLTEWLVMDSLGTMTIGLSQRQLDWHKPILEVKYVLGK